MGNTQLLLHKIAALRQRLEQAHGLTATPDVARLEPGGPSPLRRFTYDVEAGTQETARLEIVVEPPTQVAPPTVDSPNRPAQLTFRARRVLERGRQLLGQMRALSDEPLLKREENDPLETHFHATAAMIDTAFRVIPTFPEAASAQIHLCDGLDAILDAVTQRIASITARVNQRRLESGWITTLAGLLECLDTGKPTAIESFEMLAEALLGEAELGIPLRDLYSAPDQPARFVACHSLMTAQVVARVVRHDPDLRSRALEPMLAALVHDAGMLRVPVEVLVQPGALNGEQQRAVESHARAGAEMIGRAFPSAGWLADAAAGHHERLDGTGYPAGQRDGQITPLNRLLAVCDVYAALCSPRPYRPARETRTALTDTLLQAEQGALDRFHAERLLALSFFPIGSVVELSDGAVGMVVAAHVLRHELSMPARPVVALLADADSQLLHAPQYIDLAQLEGRSIVRSLTAAERRDLLARRYPELV